jgi:hypothetical protein
MTYRLYNYGLTSMPANHLLSPVCYCLFSTFTGQQLHTHVEDILYAQLEDDSETHSAIGDSMLTKPRQL